MKLRLLSSLFLKLILVSLVATTMTVLVTDSASARISMRKACTSIQSVAHRGFGPGAHRIGSTMYYENTIKAANAAFRYGADATKADIQLSAERTPYILHDSSLSRVTNGRDRRKVRYMTDAQIEKVVLPDGSHIPSLDEFLRSVLYGHSDRMLQLEFKRQPYNGGDLRGIAGLIRSYGLQNQVILGGSTKSLVKQLKYAAPEMQRVFIYYPNGSRPAASRVPRWVMMVNVNQSQASASYVRQLHNRGLKVSARSAVTSTQWNRLLNRGSKARPDQLSTDRMPSFNRWCRSQ